MTAAPNEQTNGNGNGNGNGSGHATHDVSLVTGFPAFTARRMVERLLARTADDRVLMLVRDKFKNDAVAFQALLPPSSRARLRLVEGDVADMDLGLPGPDYKALAAEITAIGAGWAGSCASISFRTGGEMEKLFICGRCDGSAMTGSL